MTLPHPSPAIAVPPPLPPPGGAGAAGLDTGVLVQRVRSLIAARRPGAARPLLAALRRVAASDPQLSELEARLKLVEGDPAAACAVLDRAIELAFAGLPDGQEADHLDEADAKRCAALFKARVEVRTQLDDRAGACRDAAEALTLDRHDTEAKALLGLALVNLGRPADALPCLAEASRELPAHPSIRLGLAHALEELGEPGAAVEVLDAGIRLVPACAPLRNAAILLRIKRDQDREAAEGAMAARSAGAADACTFGMLGHALSKLGQHDRATEAYGEALKLAPEDPYVRHLAAAGGRVASADRAPVEYVRTLFDGYAGTFEAHLVGLGYRVPGLVRRVLEQVAQARLADGGPAAGGPGGGPEVGPVLDLGCGTGLLALACMDLPFGPWVGVDASGRMLDGAREKGLYAELAEDDLIRFMAADQRRYPVILAGDVFCYFGKLDHAFAAVAARLAPGGTVVLSLERQPDGAGVELGRAGRWAHTEDHVREAARNAGLRCRSLAHEELRQEHDAAVHGMLVVLEHAEGQPRQR